MRRLLCLLALLTIAAPPSLAQASPADTRNLVSGSASVSIDSEVVTDLFAATGNQATLAATGFYRRHIVDVPREIDIDIVASIDCLNVVGRIAYMSGRIIQSNRPDIPIGRSFYTSVADNSALGTNDMVGPAYLLSPGLTCEQILPPEFVITSGNVVINQSTGGPRSLG